MPFAAAQIGLAFRNEIAPRAGLLRVREFTLAEIEHFVNPDAKDHRRFGDVVDVELTLLSQQGQADGEDKTEQVKVGDAVAKGIIDNQTLGYYMARTHLFLLRCGIHADKLRFRQHLATEMAHYAKDCWDAEILTPYGWTECVGHADRSCYDLEQHSSVSKVDLSARETYAEPRIVQVARRKLNKGVIGRAFRKLAKPLTKYLADELDKDGAMKLHEELQANGEATVKLCTGEEYEVTKEMFQATLVDQKVTGAKYLPSVIEPSFGIGRILYAILEHSFDNEMYATSDKNDGGDADDDEQKKPDSNELRNVLKLTPIIAPFKVSILPLSTNDAFTPFCNRLEDEMVHHHLSFRVDDGGVAIGRKYARSDEIGVPFAVTVDFESAADDTVTIRYRDLPNQQIRVKVAQVAGIVSELVHDRLSWAQARDKYPHFGGQ
eukprot:TRINITY_DN50961_c0_g2_i1.p2 TRINITY_DN50961_c0_g2~~TRINITY_DN50961_c0_g2_i1.p2  ORF type:complete len:480 (+),score=315.72 TRINITY_DN50961_c0_g2_i1:138-1442(+)